MNNRSQPIKQANPSTSPDNVRKPLVLGGAIGSCVHVAGVSAFLHLAETEGFRTDFLGPAAHVEQFISAIRAQDPEIVAVGYRLTADSGRQVLEEFARRLEEEGLDLRPDGSPRRFAFGGTTPVCERAKEVRLRNRPLFEAVFDGHHGAQDIQAYLRGEPLDVAARQFPDTLVERIRWKRPYPVIRHHFGLPSLEETLEGMARLAESGALDIISVATDQNAQEFFFRPELMDQEEHGAGGVPVRKREHLEAMFAATRRGNRPLLRCYSGTRDTLLWAPMLHETIRNAWCASPLFWYSLLDNRSTRPLRESIPEALALYRWHGEHDVPVEINDPHHWSLRDAPDVVAVAVAFLIAYNAKRQGVRDYVAQYMWNTPSATSFKMDLAKMLAKRDLIESLADDSFRIYRETRAGLTSMPADPNRAKGHLASSTMLQMAIEPDIVHVVGFPEADHAASPEEVIESCRIAEAVIKNCLFDGLPDMTLDPRVQTRRQQLVQEAGVLLEAIASLATPEVTDPWADPLTLVSAVNVGLLDAPQLRNNPEARGEVVTRIVNGACVAIDLATGKPVSETERVERILAIRRGTRRAGHGPAELLASSA